MTMMMNVQKETKIANIISRKLLGIELEEAEKTLLDNWIYESEKNQLIYSRIVSNAKNKKRAQIDIAAQLIMTKKKAHRIVFRRTLTWGASVAAVVVAAILGISFFSQFEQKNPDQLAFTPPGMARAILRVGASAPVMLEEDDGETILETYIAHAASDTEDHTTISVEVPKCGEYKVKLSDGSTVWLNAETIIEYRSTFADDERRVTLSGEAYFEVERDESRPFIVSTCDAEIKVLGTSFNVSSYSSDLFTAATLLSGKVEVSTQYAKVELLPGKQALVFSDSPDIVVTDVDAKMSISWTTGMFEFENMRLYDICTRLSRWYDVEFEFEDYSGEERFTGAVWRYQVLGETLTGIGLVTDVSFEYGNSKVKVFYIK